MYRLGRELGLFAMGNSRCKFKKKHQHHPTNISSSRLNTGQVFACFQGGITHDCHRKQQPDIMLTLVKKHIKEKPKSHMTGYHAMHFSACDDDRIFHIVSGRRLHAMSYQDKMTQCYHFNSSSTFMTSSSALEGQTYPDTLAPINQAAF